MLQKATLLKWLKLFGGDTRRAIVGYIVAGLILAGGGLWVLTNTAITFVIQIANTPTPLWATILLILLSCLYIQLRVRRTLARKVSLKLPPIVEPIEPPKEQTDILILLFKEGEHLTFQIAQMLTMEKKEEIVKYHLQELTQRGFVTEIDLPGIGPLGQSSWFITDKGKKYLIENKIIT